MNARPTMVDGEFTLSPTPLTTSAVTVEDSVAVAGKATAGMRLARIAPLTESGAQEACLPARAEKPGLPTLPGRMAGR